MYKYVYIIIKILGLRGESLCAGVYIYTFPWKIKFGKYEMSREKYQLLLFFLAFILLWFHPWKVDNRWATMFSISPSRVQSSTGHIKSMRKFIFNDFAANLSYPNFITPSYKLGLHWLLSSLSCSTLMWRPGRLKQDRRSVTAAVLQWVFETLISYINSWWP